MISHGQGRLDIAFRAHSFLYVSGFFGQEGMIMTLFAQSAVSLWAGRLDYVVPAQIPVTSLGTGA